jgi:hypothetical protein
MGLRMINYWRSGRLKKCLGKIRELSNVTERAEVLTEAEALLTALVLQLEPLARSHATLSRSNVLLMKLRGSMLSCLPVTTGRTEILDVRTLNLRTATRIDAAAGGFGRRPALLNRFRRFPFTI